MTDYVHVAEQIAREAGALLREGHRRADGRVHYKGAVDLVTEYDQRSETLILGRLRAAFPSHAIRAEESGLSGDAGEYEWLVDPLDGTTNFAHGFPLFAVSLALVRRRQLVAGVIYDPLRDELFAAEVGQGATLNGERLRVSTETELGRSLLATGFPYDVRTSPIDNLAEFARFYKRAQAVRRAGSAALDVAYVACGRLDGYWEFKMKPWDIGAAALMVREAGGRATTGEGDEDFLGRPSSVISNGLIHAQMLAVLREGDRAPLPAAV